MANCTMYIYAAGSHGYAAKAGDEAPTGTKEFFEPRTISLPIW